MKDLVDDWIGARLAALTDRVLAHPAMVCWITLGLTLFLGVYAAFSLGVNSDHVRLMAEDLPYWELREEYVELFPVLSNSLLVVVDAQTPEQARETAERLRSALSARPADFTDVEIPGDEPFFQKRALLYRTPDELEEFGDELVQLQPVVASLEVDPSIVRVGEVLRLGLEQAGEGSNDAERWSGILDRIGRASVSVYEENPVYLSWDEVLLEGSSIDLDTRQIVVVEPVLNFESVLPGGAPLASIREVVQELGLDATPGVRVRVTGNPALNYEEMFGLAWDIGVAGLFCFGLVTVVLYWALRSVPLVIGTVATLVVGLVWCAAFAAGFVGRVNIVSIAFAVLIIGLGVDFAIHLGMQYARLLCEGEDHSGAIHGAVQAVGASLVLCALSTAIGFLVFVPTDFRGVAELGLIAGAGMPILLLLTLTFFPALLTAWLPLSNREKLGADLHFEAPWAVLVANHPRVVLLVAFGLGGVALFFVPGTSFDENVVDMRNPYTESVQVFNELLEDRGPSSPWFVNVVTPNLEEADALAAKIRQQPLVDRVVTLSDFVPTEQEEKIEILGDVAMIFDTPAPAPSNEAVPLADRIDALERLRDFLALQEEARLPDTPLGRSVAYLQTELTALLDRLDTESDPGAAVDRFESILLGTLPDRLESLRSALEPGNVELADLPPRMVSRMRAGNGEARVQVFPSEDLQQPDALRSFVSSVREVAPRASGMAVDIVELGRVTVRSLQEALFLAILVISALLLFLWRRALDTFLVLAPLLLAGVLTIGSLVLLSIPFNFANVIVLPLLLGIGVDSGIHLVHRARVTEKVGAVLLSETTARAVFYSAVTTITSFGTLAFSDHRGIASLGEVLVIGIFFTLVCNLMVLPALIGLTLHPSKPSAP